MQEEILVTKHDDESTCIYSCIHVYSYTHIDAHVFIDVLTYGFDRMCYHSSKGFTVIAFPMYIHYRMAKTHRIPYLSRSFSAKVTYIE